jgi:S1-C subfamily serine protease
VIVQRHGPHVYILTAHHIVARANKVEVHVRPAKPGKPAVYRSAEVLARSAEADLAIVRLASTDTFPRPLPICPLVQVPAKRTFAALSAGWAGGEAPTTLVEAVKDKVLLRRPGQKNGSWTWQTQRKQTRGRSGGPLLDASGRVIGIASGHDGVAGYYGHPAELHRFLKRNGLSWLSEEAQ